MTLDKQIITSPHAPKPIRPYYSQAVKVRAGSVVYVSGQTARDVSGSLIGIGDVKAQTEKAIENLRAILRSADADLENVVKVTFYLRRIEDFEKVSDIRLKYFAQNPPASTLVEVSRLVHPDMLVEVDAVAVI